MLVDQPAIVLVKIVPSFDYWESRWNDVELDPSVFGHRLRHFRQQRGLTLDQLGAKIGRPAPYLSLLENGKREARLSAITSLAKALDIAPADLMAPEAPNRRAELEIRLDRAQQHPRYAQLGLPLLRPSAKVSDEVMVHILSLFDQLVADDHQPAEDDAGLRVANAQLAEWLQTRNGYLERIEQAARQVVSSVDYTGSGPLTSQEISDIAGEFRLTIRAVDDIPARIRSIVDEDRRTLYVAQRNELRTRQARKAVLQTIGSIALEHNQPQNALQLLTQRLETAYFAAAVLMPEIAVLPMLREAMKERDLAVGDLKERFYVSYEMAGQRFSNLALQHLEIPTHFLRTDLDGTLWKALVLDGLPLPGDVHGGVEGQVLCRRFGARSAFKSEDRFDGHYQFTDTPAGSYWCATHVAIDHDGHAFTSGVRYEHARLFRGRRTDRQVVSNCPTGSCCRRSQLDGVRVFGRMQERLVEILASPFFDPEEVAQVVEAQRRKESPSQIADVH